MGHDHIYLSKGLTLSNRSYHISQKTLIPCEKLSSFCRWLLLSFSSYQSLFYRISHSSLHYDCRLASLHLSLQNRVLYVFMHWGGWNKELDTQNDIPLLYWRLNMVEVIDLYQLQISLCIWYRRNVFLKFLNERTLRISWNWRWVNLLLFKWMLDTMLDTRPIN